MLDMITTSARPPLHDSPDTVQLVTSWTSLSVKLIWMSKGLTDNTQLEMASSKLVFLAPSRAL